MNRKLQSMRRASRVPAPVVALLVMAAMRAAAAPATPLAQAPTQTPPSAVAKAPAANRAAELPADVYRRECGDCHVAYPARLLPAADWQRILASLDRHFGVDASLDPATTRTVAAWLEAGAGRADSTSRRAAGERGMRGEGHEEHEEHDEEDEGEGRRVETRAGVASRAPLRPASPSTSQSPPPPSPSSLPPPPARAATAPTGAARATDAALPRITSRDWFRREHDEVPAATWQRASIRSAANCEACHTDAAQGRFSERALRIPR